MKIMFISRLLTIIVTHSVMAYREYNIKSSECPSETGVWRCHTPKPTPTTTSLYCRAEKKQGYNYKNKKKSCVDSPRGGMSNGREQNKNLQLSDDVQLRLFPFLVL